MKMKFMMSCKEATEISNRIQDNESVSLFKKMEFKMHIAMCKICSIYNKQNEQLNNLIEKLKGKTEEKSLPEDVKNQIKGRLKDEQN